MEGSSSPTSKVDSGVPQGSVLGPILFLIYINDLPDYIKHGSTTNLFADDSILYRSVNSQQDAAELQRDLDLLQVWERDWMMSFHPAKCQILHITKKRNYVTHKYTIHGQTLDAVDSTKYLGVYIHRTLSWNNHVDTATRKANATCAFLHRNLNRCSKETKEMAYNSLVRPMVEYSSTVWDPHTQRNIYKLEMVQRRAARFVLRDYSRTSSVTQMLLSLNWTSLYQRRAEAKVVMFYRIAHGLVDIPITLLVPTISVRGHTQRYLVPFARTLCYQKSFFPDTTRLWNSLPATATGCTTVDAFKRVVQSIPLR